MVCQYFVKEWLMRIMWMLRRNDYEDFRDDLLNERNCFSLP